MGAALCALKHAVWVPLRAVQLAQPRAGCLVTAAWEGPQYAVAAAMISTWLLCCLLATRASSRPGLAWRLEVGCDINGFFVELLGLLGALDAVVPGGVVVRGLRCDERELAKLFPGEAAAVARATSRDDDPSVPEIVHGR